MDFNCYSCGKKFRDAKDLDRHKDRKTPCLIREVAPEQVANPNRCIFCNKIFANIGNKNKHLKTCQIKNGGMEILVDKVRWEQELRILKERDVIREARDNIREAREKEKDEQIKQLIEQNQRIQEEFAILKNAVMVNTTAAQVITNNIVNTGTINITVNNYLKPSITHLLDKQNMLASVFLKIYQDNLVGTPVALIPLIWFNPDKSENFSIYLKNKSNGEMLTYDGSEWKVGTFQDGVGKAIRDRAYEITEKLCIPNIIRDNTDVFIIDNIRKNRLDEEVFKVECEKIFHTLLQNRELVRPIIPQL